MKVNIIKNEKYPDYVFITEKDELFDKEDVVEIDRKLYNKWRKSREQCCDIEREIIEICKCAMGGERK